ncbi:aminotransferase class I/II-fold pyridoxal phosphate-dependent enzyme [Aerosakkonema funiforme]|uniref:Aminotransferase class I/II-fold pyridoxal phosphate-dependent enzyme n=2 Tax=Oscillatoriophycideae TaxID=1301283 RepID=A0A926ZHL8_9CYAN|nr:aminotransferase class I/II-fold pyridoxal phosphate-dependent enzyme [Aerosakkonema funiforme]MBD2183185.1 aminotransferase class I/II-fold pyridoxal phosphate-dependent enzyme [Aerosakkonema funiforme FACHB-1375]
MTFALDLQAKTPLLDALRSYINNPHAGFYTPGHKRGEGISQSLAELLGTRVFRSDLTELPGLDNLSAPEDTIQEAQALAAEAFGSEKTWFLINGSTAGVIAAILATCSTGDKIILPRNVHSSAIAGLILSGAIPIFVNPEYDSILDIAYSITPQAVAAALAKHPDAKAVVMVYPTYDGVCGDVEAIAHLAHQYNIPLLVDEAHGPHFTFHPELPISALSAGADLTVQSTHKVLSALTQASMLHLQGNRIDRDRLTKALQLVQSTSPSYLLLASLDAARQQMALYGKELMAETLRLADEARNQISQISGLSILKTAHTPGFVNLDRTRLTVTVSNLGLTGFAADEIFAQHGVLAEFPSMEHLTFIISLGNKQADIVQLVQAFATLAKQYKAPSLRMSQPRVRNLAQIYNCYEMPLISPREAFFAATETLPIETISQRISAELVCPYPPGIPLLMPGELITPVTLEYLLNIQAMGGKISGCTDPTLRTLKVVK